MTVEHIQQLTQERDRAIAALAYVNALCDTAEADADDPYYGLVSTGDLRGATAIGPPTRMSPDVLAQYVNLTWEGGRP